MTWHLKFRTPLFAAAGAVFLALAGCAPVETAANQSPKGEAASLDKSSRSPLPPGMLADRAGKSPPASDLPPDADPAVQPAWYAAMALRRSESQLYHHYATKLRPALDRSKLKADWESHAAAMPTFLEAARTLRKLGEEVLSYNEGFRLLAESYRKQLSRAPPTYRVAATRWRELSQTEEYQVLRNEYATYATNTETFAVLIEDRARAFEKFEAEVAEATKFTRKTVELLHEFEVYAGLNPTLDDVNLRKQYRDNLKVYVKGFGDFLALHDEWSKSLRMIPLPDKPLDPPAPPSPKKTYPDPGSRLTVAKAAAEEKARIDSAAKAGHKYAGTVRALNSKYGLLCHQLDSYAGRQLPPSVEKMRDWYVTEATAINAVERLAVEGIKPDLYVRTRTPIESGSYLPYIDAKRNEWVGVARVDGGSTGGPYTVRLVNGLTLDTDHVVLLIPTR